MPHVPQTHSLLPGTSSIIRSLISLGRASWAGIFICCSLSSKALSVGLPFLDVYATLELDPAPILDRELELERSFVSKAHFERRLNVSLSGSRRLTTGLEAMSAAQMMVTFTSMMLQSVAGMMSPIQIGNIARVRDELRCERCVGWEGVEDLQGTSDRG